MLFIKEGYDYLQLSTLSGLPKEIIIHHNSNTTISANEILDDNLTLVNFWITDCPPCIKEMDFLEALYNKYKDKGLKVVGISVDGYREIDRIAPLLKSKKITYPVFLDSEMKTYNHFKINGVPHTIFVSDENEVLSVHSGYKTVEELENLIKDHLENS